MREAIASYLHYLEVERGLAANTLAAYGSDLKIFARFLAGCEVKKLSKVTASSLEQGFLHFWEADPEFEQLFV